VSHPIAVHLPHDFPFEISLLDPSLDLLALVSSPVGCSIT